MSQEDQTPEPMQDADDAPARSVPRNVPTLTEVVGADAAVDAQAREGTPQAAPTAALAGAPDAQALLALLGPDLDRLISEAIGRVLHEQMLGLNGRVQKAVAEVVREAIATAHTRSAHGDGDRKNP